MRKKTKKSTKKSAKASLRKAWTELSAKKRAEVGACEICGATEKLQVHHVLSRRARPDLLLDEKDLVVLCARHHFVLHRGHESEFFAWLAKNKPRQLAYIFQKASEKSQFFNIQLVSKLSTSC